MLSARKIQILNYVGRYRIASLPALRAEFYADRSAEAGRVEPFRLYQAGLLTPLSLRSHTFYRLTPAGAAAAGLPASVAAPLGPHALIARLALQEYCSLGTSKRLLLTPREMRAQLADVADVPGVDPAQQHYCLSAAGEEVQVHRALVDEGGDLFRLLRKCRELAASPPCGAFAARYEFSLVLLTGTEDRKKALDEQLHTRPARLPIVVEAVAVLNLLGIGG